MRANSGSRDLPRRTLTVGGTRKYNLNGMAADKRQARPFRTAQQEQNAARDEGLNFGAAFTNPTLE
jgi:hypothetical protein